MKRLLPLILTAALVFSLLPGALAGSNPLTVATGGRGITVYTASGGGKKAGTLYNGFAAELSLQTEQGLYSCWLTHDCTVWVNQKKAEKALPRDWHGEPSNDLPCDMFLAQVAMQDAPLYTSPSHRHLSARHAPGTLALVCGEFGDDYLIDLGAAVLGFMPKDSLRQVRTLSYPEAHSADWGVEGASLQTVHTGGGLLLRSASATGYSDSYAYWQVRDGEQVTVLAMVEGKAQLAGGGFIDSRFLDPNGDHSKTLATVISDKPLDRLNVRFSADPDASANFKLFAGARVQVVHHTDDWATIFLTGEGGGNVYYGLVRMQYLDFDAKSAQKSLLSVRTLYDLGSGNGGDWYRLGWDFTQGRLPKGTQLRLIGVSVAYDGSLQYPDELMCLTEEGRLITIFDDGVLEAIDPPDIQARVTSGLRLRRAPNKTSDVATNLPKGAKVDVLIRGEGWTMVRYEGKTGYVMSRYLQFP